MSARTEKAKARLEAARDNLRAAKDADRAGRAKARKSPAQEAVRVGLVAARKRSGLTQQDVSHAIRMQRASVANFETGRQRLPLDTLWEFAEIVGADLRSLIPPNTVEGAGDG